MRKPPVSVIIASHNEGQMIWRTVENLVSTIPDEGEIIVVDDLSIDFSCEGLGHWENVRVLRPVNRLGATAARNFGAQNALGQTLVFCDAHIFTPAGWFPLLDKVLQNPRVGIVGSVYREMYSPNCKGYGLVLTDTGFNWRWMEKQSNAPYPVPFLGGYFMVLRSGTFWRLGGFDEGFGLWGMEDLELVLRAWLFGFECKLHPNVEVAHLSRDPNSLPSYQIDWQRGLQNTLRVAVLHLNQTRMRRVFDHYVHDPVFSTALAALAVSDAWQKRADLLVTRRRSDDWFFERFEIPL